MSSPARDVPAVDRAVSRGGSAAPCVRGALPDTDGRCLDSDGEFGVVLITRGSEVGGGDQRVDVGTVARIANVAELDDGRMLVVATGVRRIRVEEWLPEEPFPLAVVEDVPDRPAPARTRYWRAPKASLRRLRSLLSELGDVPALPAQPADRRGSRPGRLAAVRHGAPGVARPPAAPRGRRSRGPDAAPGRAVRCHERRCHRPARRGRGRRSGRPGLIRLSGSDPTDPTGRSGDLSVGPGRTVIPGPAPGRRAASTPESP